MTNEQTICDCLFCRGEGGRRLSLAPFDLVDAAGLVDAARRNRVTVKKTDQIFVIEGIRAVACIRSIKRKLARLCGCWVDRTLRGQGIGSLMVRHRIAYIEQHTSYRAIDTYAFNSRLYLSLGFDLREGFKIGTSLLRKVVER